jgi:hypothetical protein
LDEVDTHPLQKMEDHSVIANSTIDDDCSPFAEQNDLGRSLSNIKEEYFHANLNAPV